jgi:DNA-3-methyladenine glycosylase II
LPRPPTPAHADRAALAHLAAADADLARAAAAVGPLPDRRREPGFSTLVRILVDQQLSVAAANAIWTRLVEAAAPLAASGPSTVTPERLLRLRPERMRKAGLSRPKVLYCRGIARAVSSGALDLDRIGRMDDGDAMAELTQVKGIGRWTAEIYLLFALGRTDIWPAQDVALQHALGQLKGLPARPNVKEMDALAEPWRPHRGAAARLLWAYYRFLRGRQ